MGKLFAYFCDHCGADGFNNLAYKGRTVWQHHRKHHVDCIFDAKPYLRRERINRDDIVMEQGELAVSS